MKIFMGIVLAVFSSSAFADCGTSSSDKNCQKKYVEDTKVVVKGTYSDPGGATQKDAKANCCYEKSKDSKAYEKKYSDPQPAGTKGGSQGK